MSLAEAQDIDLSAWVQLLGEPVVSCEPCVGGRNHRVDRLTCASGRRAVVKRDLLRGADGRRRIEVEFSSLQFLWRHDLRCIPQPLGADPARGWAMYAFIDGRKLSSKMVSNDDINQMVDFVRRLKALRTCNESRDLPPASEACFSAEELLGAIGRRLKRLQAVPDDAPLVSELQTFLTTDFLPQLERVTYHCTRAFASVGLSCASRLARTSWTLSPSDFGFHNALQQGDGRLVFLDFEYFGWDDPAKMIDDFAWHPGMSLSDQQIQRTMAGFLDSFEAEDPQVARRAEILWPLCGLNWCLIFLNEFMPEAWRRRGFASGDTLNHAELLAAQLAKARQMLTRVTTNDGQPFRHA